MRASVLGLHLLFLYMDEFLLIYCRVSETTVWEIYIKCVPYYPVLNLLSISIYT